jgi:hypothetical protein
MLRTSGTSEFALTASVAVVVLGVLGVVVGSPQALGGLLAIGILTLLIVGNSLHYAYGIVMFYSNSAMREEFGPLGFRLRFIIAPLAYTLMLSWAVYFFDRHNSLWTLALFLFVSSGPFSAIHVATQDKGIFAIQGGLGGIPYDLVKRWFFPALLTVFLMVYFRSFLFISYESGLHSSSVLEDWKKVFSFVGGFLAACFGGLAIWALVQKRSGWAYSASVSAGILAEIFILRSGLATLFALSFVFRHQLMYIDLVRGYLRAKEEKSRPRSFVARNAQLIIAFLLIALSQALVYLTVPQIYIPLWPWMQSIPLIHELRPVFFGLFLGVTIHHYHIDSKMWKFSNPRVLNHFKAVFR